MSALRPFSNVPHWNISNAYPLNEHDPNSRFQPKMDRFQDQMPSWVGRNLKRLCGKACGLGAGARWCRTHRWRSTEFPTGARYLDLPLGVALLAQDVPVIRRPTAHLLGFINRNVEKWKGKKQA